MNKILQDKLDQAIKESLPGQVGEMLSQELEAYKNLQMAHATLKDNFKSKSDALELAQRERDEVTRMQNDAQNILDRESVIIHREIKMDNHDLIVKLIAAEKIAQHAHEFTALVFKSPVYRTSYMNSIENAYDAQGNYMTKDGSPVEKTKTEE